MEGVAGTFGWTWAENYRNHPSYIMRNIWSVIFLFFQHYCWGWTLFACRRHKKSAKFISVTPTLRLKLWKRYLNLWKCRILKLFFRVASIYMYSSEHDPLLPLNIFHLSSGEVKFDLLTVWTLLILFKQLFWKIQGTWSIYRVVSRNMIHNSSLKHVLDIQSFILVLTLVIVFTKDATSIKD